MLKSRDSGTISVDDNGMSGDYLNGFALATTKAPQENCTSVIHIIILQTYQNMIALYKGACRILSKFSVVNVYKQPEVEDILKSKKYYWTS